MTEENAPPIRLTTRLAGVDWPALKQCLADDDFDNGRTPEQLQRSFANSAVAVLALDAGGQVIGTARALSDGVCNAYLVDVWTATPHRRGGIASAMVRHIESQLAGQHIALFTDSAIGLYAGLGYAEERVGMSKVVGTWLQPRVGCRV